MTLILGKCVTLVQVSVLVTPDSIIHRYHTPCAEIFSPFPPQLDLNSGTVNQSFCM